MAVLVLFAVLGSAVALLVLLFGDAPAVRHSPVHRLHLRLSSMVSSISRFFARHERISSALRWSVPIFYAVVVFYCVRLFFVTVKPNLEASNMREVSITATLFAVLLSTIGVTFANPGYVTAENVERERLAYKDNGLIFFGRVCPTCNWKRPARSKHCSVCNKCVSVFDHHCVWVNNCVGRGNYVWFMAFLVSNIAMMVYGAILCFKVIHKQERPHGWWKLIVRTSHGNKVAGTLLLLCVLLSAVTTIFTLVHVNYLYLGVTTNEADKWAEIEHLVDLGVLYYVREGVYVEEAQLGTTKVYLSLDDEKIQFTEKNAPDITRIELVQTDLVNIYDRGFWGNVCERLFCKV
ncbi:putative palmitoyltransferase [Clavispora lusitaniae]|uniref:Palmitoyltransferase n=1 Tax=Clavispora lusitaniae TaxID=36911 RepID=A0AA91T0Z5_CLALS|nr:putative palmitoyltransferase [Clavispora lusitaniae]